MTIQKQTSGNTDIAIIYSDVPVIDSVQDALDLIMTARHETGADRAVINKEAVAERFFILSSGLAGEILQKFINYQMKLAIYGDYTHYTSKPLHDFIYESNHGKDIFFTATPEEALSKLANV